MKKILSVLILATVLTTLVAPVMTSAGEELPEGCEITHDMNLDDCPASGDCNYVDEDYNCGLCCVLNTVYTVTDWIFFFLIAISIIMTLMRTSG